MAPRPEASAPRRILSPLGDRPMLIHAREDSPWVAALQRHLRSWTLDATLTRLLRPPADPPGTDPDAVRFIDLDALGERGGAMIFDFCRKHPEAAVITVGDERDDELYLDALRAGAIDHITGHDGHELLRALLRTMVSEQQDDAEGPAPKSDAGARSVAGTLRDLPDLPTLREMDALLLEEALRRNDGVVSRAAKVLGISAQAIHNRRRRANNDRPAAP